jgi:hypothetical protein
VRRQLRVLAIVAAASLVVSVGPEAAGAKRKPVPPKDWEGTIMQSTAFPIVTLAVFEGNGCDWAGLEGLNGFDTLVWDITGYEGLRVPATVTWTAPDPPPATLWGWYLDEECRRIAGETFEQNGEDRGKPLHVLMPTTAKWMVLQAITVFATRDVDVQMQHPGFTPKKKKKS